MKSKISSEEAKRVYKFYTDAIEAGHPVTQIAAMYNELHETDYAESTLRNRYEKEKLLGVSRLSEDEIVKREDSLIRREKRAMSAAHLLSRERTNTTAVLRELGDYSLAKDIFLSTREDLEESDVKIPRLAHTCVEKEQISEPIFVFGDVHFGYESPYYTERTAIRRVQSIFNQISDEIEKHGYKKVHIYDLADQIEGRALRKGQLITTVSTLALQSFQYIKLIKQEIKDITGRHPNTEFVIGFITSDNHSELRLHGTGRGELNDSMAELIGLEIQDDCKDIPNATVVIGDNLTIEHAGHYIMLTHGDKLPRNHDNLLKSAKQEIGSVYVHGVIRAHFHSYDLTTLDEAGNGRQPWVLTTPPVVGDSEYSRSLGLRSDTGFLEIRLTQTLPTVKMYRLL